MASKAAGSDGVETATKNVKSSKTEVTTKPLASVGDTFSFVWEQGPRMQLVLLVGIVAGVANGLVYPALAWLFSNSLSDVSGAASGTADISVLRELAFTFMVVGVYALVAATIQGWCFEHVAFHGSTNFRLKWFKALLRQDAAFFDVYDVGGIAAQVGPNANKYRRGFGRKFGEGVQFFTTGVGGIVYSFFASWKVAFVVLGVIPFVSFAAFMVMKLNQQKGSSASKTYKRAGGIAYSTVAAIKTVLSLNAAPEMIRQYSEATSESFNSSKSVLIAQGFWNGSMLGSFLLLYAILAVFGTFLIYREIEDNGCDPSGAIPGNVECPDSGKDVFGAMLGIAFAGQGISQVGNFFDAFAAARLATTEALTAINRTHGASAEVVYQDDDEDDKKDELGNTTHSRRSKKGKDSDEEAAERTVKGVLPLYEIDSTSKEGGKPKNTKGAISFESVHFTYPTRPEDPVLKGLSVEIEAGKIAAFCGPSGGGKSTIMSMIERFYDPLKGSVKLDGVDMKDINVTHLRKSIGYVGQEPTLFATSIKGNIRYGNPDATDKQIEEAARMANAHDFISSFTDGYDTQVGDKGSQLSGGQKQRIAIARVLVGDPKILLLDEATSALDSESELVVQDALDNIVAQKNITTVIIAHRLSTIRNADMINVIVGGVVAERGSHDALMEKDSYYRKLVEKQEGRDDDDNNSSPGASRNNSVTDLSKLAQQASTTVSTTNEFGPPLLSFKDCKFAYPTRPQKHIFDGFDLDIYKGETVALVGPSGGGKSTTVGLIERFYDPSGGTLEYLGTDVKSLNVAWYRDQIGYVGQEPTLFNDTIARNIAYGADGASQEEIEQACKMANAHDFIMEFNEGYETPLGETSQLSGGQKQRIAIARALVKKPKVLILDEATSALDNESESVVQAAIDKLMQSSQHTVVMIAHRLSTIRNADKIAFVAEGKVLEYGSHDKLMERRHGRYKRLFESSRRTASVAALRASKMKAVGNDDEEEEVIDWEAQIREEAAAAFDAKRARGLAKPDISYMMIGAVGAVMAGGVFPMWGVLFSETISLLFTPVFLCPAEDGTIQDGHASCQDYWDDVKDEMREDSFILAGYWAIVLFGCIAGNMLTFYGFGTASERLNKRLRDSSFTALLRQEVAFFDMRSVGSITSQLQDDCARIHAFSGDPIRQVIVASSSVITGVVLSFVFMWQFALLALACVPFMGFATSMEMKQMLGEDEGDDNKGNAELNTPGGIIVETLLNMRTVSALTMEEKRYDNYSKALLNSEPSINRDAFLGGFKAGLGQFIQQWINALQFWFGGWLLIRFPDDYDFNDFLISNFAILFSLFGLGAAFQEMADKKQVEAAAGRIFYLFDRQSTIDPLSDEGKRLEDGVVEALAIPDNTERDDDGDKTYWS